MEAGQDATVNTSNNTNSSGFRAKLLLPNISIDADDESSNSTVSNQNEVEASAIIGLVDDLGIDSDANSLDLSDKRRGSSSSIPSTTGK